MGGNDGPGVGSLWDKTSIEARAPIRRRTSKVGASWKRPPASFT